MIELSKYEVIFNIIGCDTYCHTLIDAMDIDDVIDSFKLKINMDDIEYPDVDIISIRKMSKHEYDMFHSYY